MNRYNVHDIGFPFLVVLTVEGVVPKEQCIIESNTCYINSNSKECPVYLEKLNYDILNTFRTKV